MTTRREISNAIRKIIGRMRRGAYHVQRGVLLWHADAWRGKDRGAGIMFADMEFLNEASGGLNKMSVVVHLVGRIQDLSRPVEREYEDDLMDQISEDAELLMVELQQEPGLLASLDQGNATAQEMLDPSGMVQGLILIFDVSY